MMKKIWRKKVRPDFTHVVSLLMTEVVGVCDCFTDIIGNTETVYMAVCWDICLVKLYAIATVDHWSFSLLALMCFSILVEK